MTRTVTVAYLVPVFATVDLDAVAIPDTAYDGTPIYYYPDDAVSRVFQADESITRLDDADATAAMIAGPVIDTAYDDTATDPDALTDDERAHALDIAEHTAWPAWTSG